MYGRSHQDALELEVNVLSLLLRRNQCSHRRSKPFQHASMALRCLLLLKSTDDTANDHQPPSLQLFSASNGLLTRAEDAVNRRRVKRRRQQVFWELASSTDQDEDGQELQGLTSLHGSIVRALQLSNIQELFSRIDSAAAYLWAEIARGFFLPFMTVAVASLARIRILVVQLFLHVTDAVLPQAFGLLRELGLNDDDDDAMQQQSVGNQQRSTVEEVRAFLSRQANIGIATTALRDDDDMPSEEGSRTGNSAATNSIPPRRSTEKKRVRNEVRRARFLRELGLTPGAAGAATTGRVEVGNDDDDDEGVESNSNDEYNRGTNRNRNVNGMPKNRSESDPLEDFGGLDGEAEIALDSGKQHDGKDDNEDATNASGGLGQRHQQSTVAELPEDRGESVTAAGPTSTDLLAPTATFNARDDGTLDKNLAWAERIGDEKKRKKAKASKKRRIDNDNGGGDKSAAKSTGTAGETPSKRSKATKKSGTSKNQRDNDFFDDLFG
jgi:hypothetical protein